MQDESQSECLAEKKAPVLLGTVWKREQCWAQQTESLVALLERKRREGGKEVRKELLNERVLIKAVAFMLMRCLEGLPWSCMTKGKQTACRGKVYADGLDRPGRNRRAGD